MSMTVPTSAAPPEGEQQRTLPPGTVRLSEVIHRAINAANNDLQSMAETLPSMSNVDRKKQLLDHLVASRQMFIKLLVLVKWGSQALEMQRCYSIVDVLREQNDVFRRAADSLYDMHTSLSAGKAPRYDVVSAVDVLMTGSYNRLPSIIKELNGPLPPTPAELDEGVQRINSFLALRIADCTLPDTLKQVSIVDGVATFLCANEYEVGVSLSADLPSLPWRVTHVKMLVKASSEGGTGSFRVNAAETQRLVAIATQRMQNATQQRNAFVELHHCLHFFTLSLVLEVLSMQVLDLVAGGRFIQSEPRKNELLVHYWLQSRRPSAPRSGPGTPTTATSGASFAVSIRLVDEWLSPEERSIRLVVDSLSGTPESPLTQRLVGSQYDIVPSRISFERILVAVIEQQSAQLVTRLRKMLIAPGPSKFAESDVSLSERRGSAGTQTSLRVCFFSNCFLDISVNARTGLLDLVLAGADQSRTALMKEYREVEARINTSGSNPADLLMRLRHRALHDHCESAGVSIGLEPFAKLALGSSEAAKQFSAALFFRFPSHPHFFLAVRDVEMPSEAYHLLHVAPQANMASYTLVNQYVLDVAILSQDRQNSAKRRRVDGISERLSTMAAYCRERIPRQQVAVLLSEHRMDARLANGEFVVQPIVRDGARSGLAGPTQVSFSGADGGVVTVTHRVDPRVSRLPIKADFDVNSSIDPESGVLRTTYPTRMQGLQRAVRDVAAVDHLLSIMDVAEETWVGDEVTIGEAQFSITSHWTRLEIASSEAHSPRWRVEWLPAGAGSAAGSFRLALTSREPLRPFRVMLPHFEQLLQKTHSLRALLQAMHAWHNVLLEVDDIANLTWIPRSARLVRLRVSSEYSIDCCVFLPNVVLVSDASSNPLDLSDRPDKVDKADTMNLKRIPSFRELVNYVHHEESRYPVPTKLTRADYPVLARFPLHIKQLIPLLRGIDKMLDHVMPRYQWIEAALKEAGPDVVVLSSNDLRIRFVIRRMMQYTLLQHRAFDWVLKSAAPSQQDGHHDPLDEIKQSQQFILDVSAFVGRKFLQLESQFAAKMLVQMLLLPLRVQEEVMRSAHVGARNVPPLVELHITVPQDTSGMEQLPKHGESAVIFKPAEQLIYLLYTLHVEGSPVLVPLCYHYATGITTSWEKDRRQTSNEEEMDTLTVLRLAQMHPEEPQSALSTHLQRLMNSPTGPPSLAGCIEALLTLSRSALMLG